MSNFIKTTYFAKESRDTFTVSYSRYKNPVTVYINLDNVQAISNVIHNSCLIVKTDNNELTTIDAKYFIVYCNSGEYYVIDSSEFNKFIQKDTSL